MEKRALKSMKEFEYYQSIDNEEKLKDITMDREHFKQQLLINMLKLKDHDHLTGKYRGAEQSYCNLNDQNPTFLAIYIFIF